MGRKKRRCSESDARIYCWYCERDFASEHELVHHQKEKHLRCPTCLKRMVSTSGLVVHAMQVHKRTVTVPNAIDGREDPKVDVFGMRGIPSSSTAPVSHQSTAKRARQHDAMPSAQFTQFAPQIAPIQPYIPHTNLASVAALRRHVHATPVVAAPAWAARPPHARQMHSLTVPAPSVSESVPIAVVQQRTPAVQPCSSQGPPGGFFSGAVVTAVPRAGNSELVTPASGSQAPPETPQVSRSKAITVVFDREDVCMEELRAQLPRYRL